MYLAPARHTEWEAGLYHACFQIMDNKQTPLLLVRKRTLPAERPPQLAKLVPIFAGRGFCVVSETDSWGP
jgi:hypothetical protein